MDATQPLVQATVRHALARGFLTAAQLREALILQQQLVEAGKKAPLLSVLGTRFLRPEHVQELTRFYREQRKPGETGASEAGAPLEEPAAKVDVPPDVLSRSCEMLERPPELDPEPVKQVLAESTREQDLPDKLFLGLAKKAGYPTREELQACRVAQLEGEHAGRFRTLFSIAAERRLLDGRRQKRFMRWAAQVQARAAEPLAEDDEPAAPPAPGPRLDPAGPPAPRAVPTPARVLAVSAASFEVETPRCAQCDAELDDFAVMEQRAHVVDERTLCAACAGKRVAQLPTTDLPPPPPPVALTAPPGTTAAREGGSVNASGNRQQQPGTTAAREGGTVNTSGNRRGKRLAKALRATGAFLAAGLKGKPAAAPGAAPSTRPGGAPAPRAPRQGVVIAAASGATALIALLVTIAVVVATSRPDPPPGPSAADAAWARLRDLPVAQAREGLLRFAREHVADPRAADAAAFAALLDATARQGAERERRAVDALLAEARALAGKDPQGAVTALRALEHLSPDHPDADTELRALRLNAAVVLVDAHDRLVREARHDPDGALREALAEALRWRGLGQDEALDALVLDVARARGRSAAGAAPPKPADPPPGPPLPDPPPPQPTVPSPGPAPAPPAPPAPAPAAGTPAATEATPPVDPTEQVFAAFLAGRHDDARRAAERIEDPAEKDVWQTLIDGPFRIRAPLAAAACETLTPEGRFRVMTDLGTNLTQLEVKLLRAKPEEQEALVARARKANATLHGIADLLDKASKAYGTLLSEQPRQKVVPTVYVFATRQGFDEFNALLRMSGMENALGYYSRTWKILAFYEEDAAAARAAGLPLSRGTQSTLLHEAFHQWIAQYLDDPPKWLNEGLAEFFGAGELTREGLRYGLVAPGRLENLRWALTGREGLPPPMPLDQLLRADRKAWSQGSSAVNYAHAWSVVDFLAAGQAGQRLLRDYFQALRAGRALPDAYADVFGKLDVAALEKQWRAYVDRLK